MSAKKKDTDRVIIFDTTLRDGEQSPGASLNHREKIEIAHALAALNVDVIEAGFPIASPDDFKAVHQIAEVIQGPTIAGLARTLEKDIECAGRAIAPAKKKRIHTFSSGSDIHLENILKISRAQNIERSAKAIRFARTFTDDVEYSAQDTTRSDRDYLVDLYTAAAEAGATTLNIPDTVGYAIPEEYGEMIAYVAGRVKARFPDVVISVHCHNDLGLAVSNSLAAIRAGARQVECTINGLGERAGNTSLEEIVMAIRTRQDFFNVQTGVNTKEIFRVSRMVSRMTGIAVQRNKAIVGANAFAHESGVHQDGVLKHRMTYEIMRPEDIGMDGSELVLGKHSGRHAFRDKLTKMGLLLSDAEVETAYNRFIELADKKKHIYDDDILSIARDQMEELPNAYSLEYLHVSAGTGTVPTATVRLKKGGEMLQDAGCGDGPVDAALKTIDRIAGTKGRLLDYSLQAISVGMDAMGEVTVRVAFGKDIVSAKAASTDIIEASTKAYLSCVNRLISNRSSKSAKQDLKDARA
ncbi:MAG: 2-isopropylmalate synthase [Verrucomicrobia bacterium]|nr:2-isopropylmalate synthase [Verrucomicrobiota bacterium]